MNMMSTSDKIISAVVVGFVIVILVLIVVA